MNHTPHADATLPPLTASTAPCGAQKQNRLGVKVELRLQVQTANGFKQDSKGLMRQFRDGVRDLVAEAM